MINRKHKSSKVRKAPEICAKLTLLIIKTRALRNVSLRILVGRYQRFGKNFFFDPQS
jgi:hypothetical protein